MTKKKQMIKNILKTILFLTLGIAVLWTFYFLYTKSQKPPIVFETLSAFDTTIVKKTVAAGSVIPRREVNMKSQVSGIIEKLYILAGQQVKEGDIIARIKIIPNMLNLSNAETRLRQAHINLDDAKLEYERNEIIFNQGAISKADFSPIELKYKTTKEDVESAENNLQIIKEGVSKISNSSTTNTLVKSTITGMVLDVPVKEGSQVIESNTFNEGTTIASIANMGEMIFEGKLDESEVGKVKLGMDLVLTIGAIDKECFKAKLEYISPKGVTENGAIQFLIRASVNKANTGSFLRAGYSANADIILAQKEKVLSIPESVLLFDKEKPYVEIETTTQHFEKRYIKTNLSDGINIEVIGGIKKQDKIKIPQIITAPSS
jgi:HlyD family secretion protein